MKPARTDQSAFSLVEVTLALGVAAVCLVATFALLPVGLQTMQSANQETASADIIGSVIADLRGTRITTPPGNAATSPKFNISIPASPVSTVSTATLFFNTEGQFSTSITSSSRYKLTVTFLPNGSARAATMLDMKMTWPAAASVSNASGTTEMFVALDRN